MVYTNKYIKKILMQHNHTNGKTVQQNEIIDDYVENNSALNNICFTVGSLLQVDLLNNNDVDSYL